MNISAAERLALDMVYELAKKSAKHGDVPVGAVVIDETGKVIGRGWNDREKANNPCGHAEIMALQAAAHFLGQWRLVGCTLVVSLEPCLMCAGAVVQSRIKRLVFGAWDPKAGACGSIRDVVRDSRINHQLEVVGGVDEERFQVQLQEFFAHLKIKP